MQIQVVSKGIDVSPALRERIAERVEGAVDKYFGGRSGEAFVTVARDGHGFRVDSSLHLPSGALMQAHGSADDAYAAAEDAMTKLEKRLRRYKRRLKDKRAGKSEAAETAAITVFEAQYAPDVDEDEDEPAVDMDAPPAPAVIAETNAGLATMTVAMAVLELEVADAPVLVFRNIAHGGINVVYRRPDGHIGWVDPARERDAA